ncbi:MAG: phosphatase PAP2 family protein [Cyclobacteriaceae bacterium]|jgi:undecaprenyl-diphosphatase|nr:phosphatase PAP2 family protein [Cyclobacteriaceae bacterium]
MDFIAQLDTEVFFWLNSLHTPWLDPVMFYATKTALWIPFFGLLLYLLIKKYKRQVWIPLIGVVLCLAATDRITSGIMKPAFERLRPSHEPVLMEKVHTVNGYRGGKFGFASSHAANSFGIAMLFFLLLRSTARSISWIFLWAVLFSYTRIYLGVHYPGDILVGAIIGLCCGWIATLFTRWLEERQSSTAKM